MTTTERWRVAAAIGAVCAVLLGAGSCGDDSPDGPADPGASGIEHGGEPADPEGAAPVPGVEFTASVEVGDDGVAVHYELVNDSSSKVYVANRVGRSDEYGRVNHDPAFVYVTGAPDGGVDLSKRVFATPDTDIKSWAQAPRVGVTAVPPGGRVTESFTVSMPLERHQPWGDDYGYGEVSLPDPVETVRFCLGAIAAPLPSAAGLEKVDDGPVINHGNATNAAQHVYCSDPVDL